ncbi:hypothetical protein GIB67_041531 [Kingdonia uniflora]|uniref:Uncharacterized protein n=1 Tax=Kingdonia uniflora TaxID=39325 RepID=A0A7J7MQJ1_9MAGN|nr:hypothetical protein GIB67_041531 [Kingdonia uniflora]
MQRENNVVDRQLFKKAVQASLKNRFAWHVWGIFGANLGNIDKGRILLKIDHTLNPRDLILLQSLTLLEYRYSTANLARVLFRRASELDPSLKPTGEAQLRYRSPLNINFQSYLTWMTWTSMEEEQGNTALAEEIRDLYFQQHTEVVDDTSCVTGLLDIFDPAFDSIKSLLKIYQTLYSKGDDNLINKIETTYSRSIREELADTSLSGLPGINDKEGGDETISPSSSSFDLDTFIKDRLCIDVSKLEVQMEMMTTPKKIKSSRSRN